MKTLQLSLATLGLLFITAITNTGNAQSNLSSWTALTDFHKVMSQTVHPSEEGNLEPIKTRVGELVEKAEALKASATVFSSRFSRSWPVETPRTPPRG